MFKDDYTLVRESMEEDHVPEDQREDPIIIQEYIDELQRQREKVRRRDEGR